MTGPPHVPPFVEVVGLSKRFGDVQALSAVDLQVKPGQFHALIGENGAGKSTLAKCIMGVNRMDAGEIRVNGQRKAAVSPREARASGIGMVFQHFTLIPSMTVAENLVLARPDLPLIIRWRAEMERLRKFIEHAPFPVDLDTPVSQLAAGQKQKVEILKELYLETRFLMLDEPTSVLTPDEADEVLGLLRTFVSAGRLSVLMITHKFREVMGFADQVTVLRRGKLVGSRPVSQTSPPELAAMMMGTTAATATTEKVERIPGKSVFTIDKLCVRGDNGLSVMHDPASPCTPERFFASPASPGMDRGNSSRPSPASVVSSQAKCESAVSRTPPLAKRSAVLVSTHSPKSLCVTPPSPP